MKPGYLALIPVLAVFAPVHAAAPGAPTPAMDTRCYLAASAVARNATDPQTKQAAALTSLFYLGRISARLTDAEMESTTAKEVQAVQGTQIEPVLNQCGEFMTARGRAVQAMNQRMKAAEQGTAGAKK